MGKGPEYISPKINKQPMGTWNVQHRTFKKM